MTQNHAGDIHGADLVAGFRVQDDEGGSLVADFFGGGRGHVGHELDRHTTPVGADDGIAALGIVRAVHHKDFLRCLILRLVP